MDDRERINNDLNLDRLYSETTIDGIEIFFFSYLSFSFSLSFNFKSIVTAKKQFISYFFF